MGYKCLSYVLGLATPSVLQTGSYGLLTLCGVSRMQGVRGRLSVLATRELRDRLLNLSLFSFNYAKQLAHASVFDVDASLG